MSYVRPIVSALILFLVVLPLFSRDLHAETSSSTPVEQEQTNASPTTDDDTTEASETSQEQKKTPLTTTHSSDTTFQPQAGPQQEEKEPSTLFYGYWKQGLYIKNPNKRFELKIGGKIMVDGRYINSGSEIQTAFPDFYGSAGDFRKLSVAFSGNVWEKTGG